MVVVVVVDALSRHARGTLITALLLVLGVGYAQRREAGTHALQTCPNVATKQFIHRLAWNRGSNRQNYIMQ